MNVSLKICLCFKPQNINLESHTLYNKLLNDTFLTLSKIIRNNEIDVTLFLVGCKVGMTLYFFKNTNIVEGLNITVCDTCIVLFNKDTK